MNEKTKLICPRCLKQVESEKKHGECQHCAMMMMPLAEYLRRVKARKGEQR